MPRVMTDTLCIILAGTKKGHLFSSTNISDARDEKNEGEDRRLVSWPAAMPGVECEKASFEALGEPSRTPTLDEDAISLW